MSEELSQRAKLILSAVIANYVATAEPVGSRTIFKLAGITVSPATIRNVMADLEEMGYLTQPHVSAGRVPTSPRPALLRGLHPGGARTGPAGQGAHPPDPARGREDQALDMREVLKAATRSLSLLSQQAAVVAAPPPEQEVFRHMEFVLLWSGLILVVFVARSGGVQNRIIEAEDDLTQDDLDKFTRYLNELLADLTLNEVKARVAREMAREKVRFDRVLSRALKLGQQALPGGGPGDVFLEGQTNLMGAPEFADVARLRLIFRAFEEKSTLLRLEVPGRPGGAVIHRRRERAGRPRGTHGRHRVLWRAQHAAGGLGGHRTHAHGLLQKVIPIVDYTAQVVSRILGSRD